MIGQLLVDVLLEWVDRVTLGAPQSSWVTFFQAVSQGTVRLTNLFIYLARQKQMERSSGLNTCLSVSLTRQFACPSPEL